VAAGACQRRACGLQRLRSTAGRLFLRAGLSVQLPSPLRYLEGRQEEPVFALLKGDVRHRPSTLIPLLGTARTAGTFNTVATSFFRAI